MIRDEFKSSNQIIVLLTMLLKSTSNLKGVSEEELDVRQKSKHQL